MASRALFDGSEAAAPRPEALTVSELLAKLKARIEPAFRDVWVAGEVAEFRGIHASGHAYFSLKDPTSLIHAKMWRSSVARLRFQLENGAAVLCHGEVDLWAPRGDLSFVIDRVIPQGVGELAAAFEQLRRKLLEEGLFAEERKRPLPRFPRGIGLVTSREGAAIRDFLRHVQERFPVRVVLAPTAVQGETAPASVAAAIAALSARAEEWELDAMAVVRGGGSMEDLAAFNSESVARAIAACRVPVVTGVGHEVDTTIADLVADRRAKTPTDAANVLLPDREALWDELGHLAERVGEAADRALSEREMELDRLRDAALRSGPEGRLEAHERDLAALARLLVGSAQRRVQSHQGEVDRWRGRLAVASPRFQVETWGGRLSTAGQGLTSGVRARLAAAEGAIALLAARLEGVSPVAVLARGYSLARKADSPRFLTDARDLQVGDAVVTRLATGSFRSRVEGVDAEGRGS